MNNQHTHWPQKISFTSACRKLGLQPINCRKRMVTQRYLRKVQAGIGQRFYYLPTGEGREFFTYEEKSFTPKTTEKEILGTEIYVTAAGRKHLLSTCDDLIAKPKKLKQDAA